MFWPIFKNLQILNIGTCPLHVVHNSFCKGVTALNYDVDQYAVDIHFFSKVSTGRRADYKSFGDVSRICYEAFHKKMGHTSKSCGLINWTA